MIKITIVSIQRDIQIHGSGSDYCIGQFEFITATQCNGKFPLPVLQGQRQMFVLKIHE